MSEQRSYHTAARLIDHLTAHGLAASRIAEEVGVSRTTLYNWKDADVDESSPPSEEQIASLVRLVAGQFEAAQGAVLSLLESDAMDFAARHALAHAIRHGLHQGPRRVEALIEEWDEVDDELGRLIARHGRVVLDQLEVRMREGRGEG
jgi:AcrR family transcriptional regulator